MSMATATSHLQSATSRLVWQCSRAARALWWHGGPLGVAALLLLFVAAAALNWKATASSRLHAAQQTVAAATDLLEPVLSQAQPQSRLKRFDSSLAAHEDIPFVLLDLMQLAQAERLQLARADYNTSVDVAGGFVRYRMTWPLTGDADALQRFTVKALKAQPALALQSVQFRRERGDAREIEARLQWTLFTRLPNIDKTALPASAHAKKTTPGAVQ
jgi:hypothetical protein